MGHVSADLLKPRPPRPGEDYDAYLDGFGLLDRGFGFGEIVRGATAARHSRPPRDLWPRIVPTLALALELRARMLAHGASGLLVAAAFRPHGGAADSRHKFNAAIDLDLLAADDRDRLAGVFARVAAQLWRDHEHLRAGVGTYAPDGRLWSYRVHLDTGWRFRCWQGLPGGGWAARPAALVLAPPDPSDLDGAAYIAGRERAADDDCVRQGAAWPT